jgi:hypothetical protein
MKAAAAGNRPVAAAFLYQVENRRELFVCEKKFAPYRVRSERHPAQWANEVDINE